MKILTYNIRVQMPKDKGVKSWFKRKSLVADIISSNDADIVSIQECGNWYQKLSLLSAVDGYSYHGKGRDGDFNPASEEVGVLWKKDKFKLINKGSFFLSETPNKRSRGWDAKYNRVCAWVKLEDKATMKQLYVLSTHFDSAGSIARKESAKLVLSFMKELDAPSMVMGDLNTNVVMGEGVIELLSTELKNADDNIVNMTGTYNGFRFEIPDLGYKADYIFTKGISHNNCSIIYTRYDGAYPSDHYPVMLDFDIK